MKTEEKLKKLILEWDSFKLPDAVEREFDYSYLDSNKILAIIGPRRAGKTYLCFQLIKRLLAQKKSIVYINFEDERLYPLNGDELTKLMDVYLELKGPKEGGVYLFLDEIQNVPNWQMWCRRVSETMKDVKLVITGSSSKLLSKEISTELRGRTLAKQVFPLSFKEFLKAKGVDYSTKELYYSPEKSGVKRAFNEYVEFGGFPETLATPLRQEVLQEYYSTVFYKDIIERFSVNNIPLLEDFLKIRVNNFGRPMTFSRSEKDLKALGHHVGKATLQSYFSHAKDVFLLFEVKRYSPKIKDQMRHPRKVYAIDTGLINSIRFGFSEDYGRFLENVVFLDLLRNKKDVYYHKERYECDFVLMEKNQVVEAIQVTKTLEKNREREIKGLVEAMKGHNLEKGLILTDDEKEELDVDGLRISVKPVWLWLIES